MSLKPFGPGVPMVIDTSAWHRQCQPKICRELGARRWIPAVDYLLAASAADRGFGVLHADKHFDLLAGVLGFESVRIG
jgi:hypothetical protein